ncbi:hypothetical protein [Pandoraea pnomenusa]|uniref:hypothetical protein n=1 Tax=Pandoraea pnomenusa TaxID=93220 RepID=UPI00333FE039
MLSASTAVAVLPTGLSPQPVPANAANAVLRLASEAANCICDGFRSDFANAAACVRENGLAHALGDVWQCARDRLLSGGSGLAGAVDVTFACALSAVTVGATCRYLWPELRSLENAIGQGQAAQRQWAIHTDAILCRRTLGEVTAMRQCMVAFDATQAAADKCPSASALRHASPQARRKFAEMRISEALVLHVADAPQINFNQSDRVAALCQLLAHGLGFKLPAASLRTLQINDAQPSLIRYDDAFALLRDRLEPDWRNDDPGSPTFNVHPVDVQLLDPAETTDDLSRDTRDARRLLTRPDALRRVRTRVVSLIADSVREDCGGVGDWRHFAESALRTATETGMACEQVMFALGIATCASVSARRTWCWTDESPQAAGDIGTSTIPVDVAQWIARVMLVAGNSGLREPCPHRLAALARADTPASLVVGSEDWRHLVDGIDTLGRDHWRVDYANVCEVSRA